MKRRHFLSAALAVFTPASAIALEPQPKITLGALRRQAKAMGGYGTHEYMVMVHPDYLGEARRLPGFVGTELYCLLRPLNAQEIGSCEVFRLVDGGKMYRPWEMWRIEG